MMVQFEGREHELIETLKTMQERSEAQRARAAVEESATFEAKTRGHDKTDGEDSVSSSASKSLLEQAMEKGDWQAVGQAAAMMGGDSIMIEDDSLDRSHHSSISSSLSDSRSHSASRGSMPSRDKSERIQRLDSLIAVGDWAGIVAVASQYQAIDEEVDQNPPIDAALTTDEERDALAQAEMWHTIAQQSKQDISSGEFHVVLNHHSSSIRRSNTLFDTKKSISRSSRSCRLGYFSKSKEALCSIILHSRPARYQSFTD